MEEKDNTLDIEELFGSKTKVRFLKTLYKYRNIEQSISWIAREAGISVNQAKLISDTYRHLGVINSRPTGNSILVSLRKNSIWYELISTIMKRYYGIKEEIIDSIRKKTSHLNARIFIYGSFIRGDNNDSSDIDVLIIFDDEETFEASKPEIIKIDEDLSEKFQKKFSILALTYSDYDKNYVRLKNNIEKEGRRIDGQSR